MTLFVATSTLTQKRNTREIPITRDEYHAWTISGDLIQDYFPQLSEDDREFLLTGITPEEWRGFMTA